MHRVHAAAATSSIVHVACIVCVASWKQGFGLETSVGCSDVMKLAANSSPINGAYTTEQNMFTCRLVCVTACKPECVAWYFICRREPNLAFIHSFIHSFML